MTTMEVDSGARQLRRSARRYHHASEDREVLPEPSKPHKPRKSKQKKQPEPEPEEDDVSQDDDDNDQDVSDDDIPEDDDDDYVDSRKRKQKAATKSRKRTKPNPITIEQIEDFEENELYKALSDPEVSVQTLGIEWIELFLEEEENNGIVSITNLINLLLRSCGCIHLFQPHDLANLDSAAETVGELVIAFKSQKSHEYPFISNNRDLKFFKSNVLEFFTTLTELSHDKGLLYIPRGSNEPGESLASPLITQIFTWLLTLTNCSIRPLRYISTTVLMSIQSKLCELISDISSGLERHQRQLSNSKSGKKRQLVKIQTITESIQDLNHQRETILEYFTDITESAFVHRYRDIDPLIRQDCISGLSDWMISFPDFFFQTTYLRYFGWLLSDPSSIVRGEVTKCLSKLYKTSFPVTSVMSAGFNDFTERFKTQIMNMAYKDNDSNVRLNSAVILEDLVKLGLLDYDEQLSVILNFMVLVKGDAEFGKVNNDKLRHVYSRFIHNVNSHRVNSVKADNDDYINVLKEKTTLDIDKCVQIKTLITVLQAAESKSPTNFLKDMETEAENADLVDKYLASIVFKSLYLMSDYHETWEFLLKYMVFDIFSIELGDENDSMLDQFRNSLELSLADDKLYLMNFIHGALSALSIKKKYTDEEVDNPKAVVYKAIDYLDPLLNELLKYPATMLVFLRIWDLLISDYSKFNDVISVFQNCERLDLFNLINAKLLSKYSDDTLSDEEYIARFDPLFATLLTNQSSSLVSDFKPRVDDLLRDLHCKANNELNGLPEQDLFDALPSVSNYAIKVNQIGNYTDIDKFVDELNPKFLLLISSWGYEGLMSPPSQAFLETTERVIKSYRAIIDVQLTANAAKFEKLLGSEVVQSNYDMVSLFGGSILLLLVILDSVRSLDDIIDESNEKIGSSSIGITVSEAKTTIDKLNDLRTLLLVKFIDLIVSFKLFFEKFKSENEFTRFDEFFGNSEIQRIIKYSLPSSIQNKLLNMFLIKESKLSRKLRIELERNDEEGVNFDEMEEDRTETEITFQNSDIEDEEEDEDSVKQKQVLKDLKRKQAAQKAIWSTEKDLCVYFVKLLTLVNLGMVDSFVEKRLKLNARKIGGLFGKIVTHNEPEPEPVPSNGSDQPENNSTGMTTDELELNINESTT